MVNGSFHQTVTGSIYSATEEFSTIFEAKKKDSRKGAAPQ
jgi:hypothetical protein